MSNWFTDEDVAEAVRAAVNAGRDNKTLIECVVAALSAVNPFEWRPIETAKEEGWILAAITLPARWDGEKWDCGDNRVSEFEPTFYHVPPSPPEGK